MAVSVPVGRQRGTTGLFAVVVILTPIGSGSVWLAGADRSQAMAALDGAAPRWLGRFTSFGTPIAVNITSGIIGSAFVFFVFLAARLVGRRDLRTGAITGTDLLDKPLEAERPLEATSERDRPTPQSRAAA